MFPPARTPLRTLRGRQGHTGAKMPPKGVVRIKALVDFCTHEPIHRPVLTGSLPLIFHFAVRVSALALLRALLAVVAAVTSLLWSSNLQSCALLPAEKVALRHPWDPTSSSSVKNGLDDHLFDVGSDLSIDDAVDLLSSGRRRWLSSSWSNIHCAPLALRLCVDPHCRSHCALWEVWEPIPKRGFCKWAPFWVWAPF